MTLRVDLIAWPQLEWDNLAATGYTAHDAVYGDPPVTESDELVEFAGRQCYLSWDRPNPATATNAGYIGHAVHQLHHESILEHAHVVLRLTGISRSLLLELERHRFISFSVLSQRYCDAATAEPVIPPLFRGTQFEQRLLDLYGDACDAYDALVRDAGCEFPNWKRKQVREAARAVMPNMTGTEAVVSANLRAWRYVIGLRATPQADAEIRELACELLRVLLKVAPNVMADMVSSVDDA